MSISAKPWDGGGASSVPDASETTKGKIKIATTSESNTGTDDLTAMTPAKVKARIDAALVGGVEYKGDIAVADFSTLLNAEKGDLYKISTGGTAGDGRVYAVGDSIIVNADMGGTFADSKLDKIDNTESITSVNGYSSGAINLGVNDLSDVTITGASTGEVLRYSGSAWVDAQLAYSDLSGTPSLATVATSGAYSDLSGTPTGINQFVDVEIKTPSSFSAVANYLYICGYGSGTQTITFPDASSSTAGDIIALSSNGAGTYALELVSSDGTTNDLFNQSNVSKGGTNGPLTLTVQNQISYFVSDGSRWVEFNKPLSTVATSGAYSDLSGTPSLATVATSGAYSDLSGTPSLATVATSGAYSDLSGKPTVPSALDDLSDVTITGASTGEVLRYSGSAWVDAQLAYSDLSGTPSLATVATSGAYSDLSGTPSLATVATSGAYSDLSGKPTVPSALDDLSDVTITGASTGEVLRYSGSAWVDAQLAYSDLSGTPSLATVATSGAYSDLSGTPSLATVATSGAYSDLSGKPTVPSALDDLSDVTITGASTGEVLRYSGSAWVDAQLAYSDLSGTPSLATVATSGAYSDLSGKPTVPSALNDLSDVTITGASTGEYLRYSGSAWVDTSLSVVDDTSPQLGGDLDLNSNKLTSASNGNVELTPHGTGHIKLGGNTNPAEIRFFDEAGTNYIALKAPADADLGGDYTLTLPVDDGTANQVLKTDGSGVLSWVDQSGGGSAPTLSTLTATSNQTHTLSAPSAGVIEDVYKVNNTTYNVTIALVASATVGSGFKYQLKRLGTGTVTIDPDGSETIDHAGQSTLLIPAQYDSITLMSDGSNWIII